MSANGSVDDQYERMERNRRQGVLTVEEKYGLYRKKK